jgi:hypothetical protein
VATPAARDFEPGRISPGETIAAASGIALFVFLFFNWFGPLSAWESFDVVDLVLAVLALWAIAIAGAKAAGMHLPGGDSSGTALARTGLVATSITLTFVLEGDQRKVGLWLAFVASIGILYGGWRAMHEAPGTPGPLGRSGRTPSAAPNEPTTPMASDAAAAPGVPGGGAAGVSPGKEGPGAPHPGTSTGGPGDAGDAAPPVSAAAADPVPGSTAPRTPPGIAGEPPAGEGTHPPGL